MKRAYSPDSDPEDKRSNTNRKKCREDDDDGFIPVVNERSLGSSRNDVSRSNILRLRLLTANESRSKGETSNLIKKEETLEDDKEEMHDDDKEESSEATIKDDPVLSDDSINLDDKESDNKRSNMALYSINSSDDEEDSDNDSSLKANASSSEEKETDSDKNDSDVQDMTEEEEENDKEKEEEEEEEEEADESMEENRSQTSDDDDVARICHACGRRHFYAK